MKKNEFLLNIATSDTQRAYVQAVIDNGSNAAAAKALGINRRTLDRGMKRLEAKALASGWHEEDTQGPAILVLDIETSPMETYSFKFWDKNGPHMLKKDWSMIAWAAKWVGQDEVISRTLGEYGKHSVDNLYDFGLVKDLYSLISSADIIVGHNAKNFDLKRINTRLLVNGFTIPPLKSKVVDTLALVKRNFAFSSNSLDFVCKALYGYGKAEVKYIDLYKKCMQHDEEAWNELAAYNETDVILTEQLYLDLRVWDHLHPNLRLYGEHATGCPNCGSPEKMLDTGKLFTTRRLAFPLLECGQCGHSTRGQHSIKMT